MCQTISFSKSSREALAALASLIASRARLSSIGCTAKITSAFPKQAGMRFCHSMGSLLGQSLGQCSPDWVLRQINGLRQRPTIGAQKLLRQQHAEPGAGGGWPN